MAQENIIQQGKFTQTTPAVSKTIQLRSDVDWMRVYNYSNAAAQGSDGVEFYWQRGMDQGSGIIYEKGAGATDALEASVLTAPSGFYLVDSSITAPEAKKTVNSVSNATQPVIALAAGHGYVTGDVIRLSSVIAQKTVMGIDFQVTLSGNNATINAILANTPGAGAGGGGYARRIPFDPIWYPRNRVITNIQTATNPAQSQVTVTVPHGYSVGMEIFFNVPSPCGMVEMNGLTGTIVDINPLAVADPAQSLDYVVDINSSNFTTFAWPKDAVFPTLYAQSVPAGENTAEAIRTNGNILADATLNTAYIGMKLPAGDSRPGGGDGNVMYWVAGKSFQVTNE